MATKKWTAFPHASKAFDYSASLEKNWPKLHAGDQEPFPDAALIAKLVKANSQLGKANDAEKIAQALQHAWIEFHTGNFQQAYEAGMTLGAVGSLVAAKAMGIHAVYLVADDKEKSARFLQVCELAETAIEAMPKHANAHYLRAFSLGRYSQLLSITKALAQGIAGKVKDSLDTTLNLAPKHAEAHLAMALYHAEIVGKVGSMLASLTYGAKAGIAEDHLKTALRLTPHSPIAYVEKANAMLLLHGEKGEDDAAEAFDKAGKIKPIDAMEALDAAFARDQLA